MLQILILVLIQIIQPMFFNDAGFQFNSNLDHLFPVVPAPDSTYPCPEVQVPYYHRFHMHLNVLQGDATSNFITYPLGKLIFRTADVATFNISQFQRSCGEDLNLGFWTGACATTSNYSAPAFGSVVW